MHLSEFKAWFEGFTEDMDGPPSPKQWRKIQARVKEITADYTPATVFIDRYVYPYRRYYDGVYGATLTGGNVGLQGSCQNQAAYSAAVGRQTAGLADHPQLVARSDWRAAGNAEYRAN